MKLSGLLRDYGYHWDPNVGVDIGHARCYAQPARLTDRGASVIVSLPFEQSYWYDVVSVSGKRVISASGAAKSFAVATACGAALVSQF
jgi:hypothetical protein